jgi:hypothetical protein
MRFTATLIALLLEISCVSAWAPLQRLHSSASSSCTTTVAHENCNGFDTQSRANSRTAKLQMADSSGSSSSINAVAPKSQLSEDEWSCVKSLHDKASNGDVTLKDLLLEALPKMDPRLTMKLRQTDADSRKEFLVVSNALNGILDSCMEDAHNILQELLGAGEIRKLDAMIGKFARAGKLDVAFFQVLNMNLQDASENQTSDDPLEDQSANRYQILKHVYTRCQEEVEKTVPPGVAFLNMLLRTDQEPIRQNQLKHYLCPQPNVILVPHTEFVEAIANAVKQIRTVENAGGASRETAADLVETCRNVAMEARVVIGEHFGRESKEFTSFEDALMPVFRPSSPESPFIKGV